MHEERWEISAHRVAPGETIMLSESPAGIPIIPPRWIARVYDRDDYLAKGIVLFGWTQNRALRRARKYIKAIERSEESEVSV